MLICTTANVICSLRLQFGAKRLVYVEGLDTLHSLVASVTVNNGGTNCIGHLNLGLGVLQDV